MIGNAFYHVIITMADSGRETVSVIILRKP